MNSTDFLHSVCVFNKEHGYWPRVAYLSLEAATLWNASHPSVQQVPWVTTEFGCISRYIDTSLAGDEIRFEGKW